ncbi:MAG: AI-2E family transporter [Gemmatimonadaceae bacterium]
MRRIWILPGFTAILVTVLLLWLAATVADLLLLLFLGLLLAVYLGAVTDVVVARTRLPRLAAFALTVVGTLAVLAAIGSLLIPPVVEQTRELVRVLPTLVVEWERRLELLLVRIPGTEEILASGEHRIFAVALAEAQRLLGSLVPRLFDTVHLAINLVAVLVMAIYFAIQPDIYRQLALSVTPPQHREAAREVIEALSETLRAWTIAQLLAMTTLAALTALGLWLLDVPYWLAFGIFTGLVAIVPFFGTLVSTLLPAAFVIAQPGGGTLAILVILLGVVIHVAENQLIIPMLMHRRVNLPPVLTIMSVLICGKLLGPFGLLVAVPTLAVVMVLVRRILIVRVYQDAAAAPAVVTPVLTRRQRRAAAQQASRTSGAHPRSSTPRAGTPSVPSVPSAPVVPRDPTDPTP